MASEQHTSTLHKRTCRLRAAISLARFAGLFQRYLDHHSRRDNLGYGQTVVRRRVRKVIGDIMQHTSEISKVS